MADFVAVIRRTVDGLSDNVPEMRAKVYEKARGAVRRQLESMKPRPSDEMIERQMVKLEAAISEVESDHAEALPSLDEPQVDSAPEVTDVEEHAPAAEVPPVAETVEDEHPEPVAEDAQEVVAEQVEPHEETAAAPVEAPEPVEEVADREAEPEEVIAAAPEEEQAAHVAEADDHLPVEAAGEPDVIPSVEPEHAFVAEQPDEVPSWDEGRVPEPAEAEPAAEQAEEPAQNKPALSSASEWELPEWNDPVPVAAHNEPGWTKAADTVAITDEIPDLTDYEPVETVTPIGDGEREKDGTAEPSHSWSWDDSDPFAQSPAPAATAAEGSEPSISDWSWPVEKQTAAEPQDQKPADDAWNDVDDLLEHGSPASAAAAAAHAGRGTSAALPADELDVPSRPVSYRVEPKRSSFGLKAIGLAAVLLLIIGGAAYAYWQNQNAVNSWVANAISSLTAQVPGQTTPEVPATEDGAKDVATPDTSAQPQPGTDVASLDSSNKFTQRLQADGTEIDQGPATSPAGENVTEEGKSVAAQTEAGKPENTVQGTPTTQAGQTAEAQPAQPVAGQQTATDPATQEVPAGAQKMFLYEERLGQSAPTAIEGNVVWSVKEESPGGDAKPEPVVQAQINVPERGLTALMTIKRNADSSLPASHVVEFVFSLPENFEGGSIESVQRVAMKRNEQDRGDPLIAVPAKITDDFHMIALNDFPEAVTTNMELLRSRNWIDIPLTYRNGRRALLTLEKGTAGTEAFTKTMQAWSLVAKPNPAGQ
ncbi:hypothetical protein OIU34_31365 [Pararhizobium sp. BT-229]|uniref:hypothetical protein n=1 Tax=Pararhizobium sp. BT-229 TaxID=2986923 RepID=UPI0021F6BBED|nr:hypothetical protein [Pararhizobium sp. BT-229]MCV9966375.1 hypothetical protein [Pararhizobium sp. BT-229]